MTRRSRARLRGLVVVALVVVVLVAIAGVTATVVTSAAARRFDEVDPPAPAAAPRLVSASTPAPESAPAPATAKGSVLGKVRVVAIGDSVTAGTNCDCAPFPELYADELADSYDVRTFVRNDGEGGETSADVLNDLKHDRAERDDVAGADLIVLTIGANDFGPRYRDIASGECGGSDGLNCATARLGDLQDNLTAIVEQIRTLRAAAPTAILMTGYWNVFEDGDVARASMTRQGLLSGNTLTVATNQVIERVADRQQATYVDLYRAFKGVTGSDDPTALLAADGDHPNAAGHKLIAKTLLQAGTAPLTLAR